MLKKILIFIKKIKIQFSVYLGKPENSDQIRQDFENNFKNEIQKHK
jgi:hypothetical protein